LILLPVQLPTEISTTLSQEQSQLHRNNALPHVVANANWISVFLSLITLFTTGVTNLVLTDSSPILRGVSSRGAVVQRYLFATYSATTSPQISQHAWYYGTALANGDVTL
jgi:hypothetical protein